MQAQMLREERVGKFMQKAEGETNSRKKKYVLKTYKNIILDAYDGCHVTDIILKEQDSCF
jgi:hypothetical protein